ncbi:MAG: hypothetical protein KatS3mg102_2250 [Planctomycetota bacterium]|nr:MAG: hypothetical protein KatS3mg102_2250 [Planctomycetota bacterium]
MHEQEQRAERAGALAGSALPAEASAPAPAPGAPPGGEPGRAARPAVELAVTAPAALRGRRLVLDTSIFTNPDIRGALGESPTGALLAFLELARRLPGVEFYMPPSIWQELLHFLDPARVPPEVELVLQRKAPAKYELSVPAFLLYELIDDVRRRVDKGLRVAEESARRGLAGTIERESEIIQALRKKYREALREGIIDSTEDVELILLAKEMDAIVCSADRGVLLWAEKLGLRWLEPRQLPRLLKALAEQGG